MKNGNDEKCGACRCRRTGTTVEEQAAGLARRKPEEPVEVKHDAAEYWFRKRVDPGSSFGRCLAREDAEDGMMPGEVDGKALGDIAATVQYCRLPSWRGRVERVVSVALDVKSESCELHDLVIRERGNCVVLSFGDFDANMALATRLHRELAGTGEYVVDPDFGSVTVSFTNGI